MAILALMFWEPDAMLLADCVTHDLGEYRTGDIPFGSPNKDNDSEIDARDEMCMYFNSCDPRLKFLDSLDAYLWAKHHAPTHVAGDKDWQNQRKKLLDDAVILGVSLDRFNITE